jgi:CRISPR-associated protein Cas1
MRHLLNTLYITTQGAYLAREGETILVRIEHETKIQVPVHTLAGIVCFGQVTCSPPCMELCADKNVAISFMTENGRYMARVQGPVSGNVLLRKEQYRSSENEEKSVAIARSVVLGKIANCRTVLLRAAREREHDTGVVKLVSAARGMVHTVRNLKTCTTLDSLRGCEGEASGNYFGVFDDLIVANKNEFQFTVRSRRPPMDNVNALLSFTYTLLAHDVASACETVGLDPAVGFLHRDRPGRPSLALDLMEELRPVLADRIVLSLINRQQVRANGFTPTESGGVIMSPETKKVLLTEYQKKKQEEITHPFIKEKMQIGLLPFVQARLLARHLRGDLSAYPPFAWK